MAQYKVVITLHDSDIRKVRKEFSSFSGARITKVNQSPSRRERFDEARGQVEEGQQVVEQLRDEMQEWHDSMPESLQSGSKGDSVLETADQLDEVFNEIDSAVTLFDSIEFPGMYS
jgi:uncharacterized coiled-coil DUF342 family protein|tara:strand:+ start:1104 stop:1451 length:348 start_codon:yes stop_codon:yes gene_type:complete